MNDDDYRRLLSSVDGADDDVPSDFADELWYDLRLNSRLQPGELRTPR